MNAFHSFFVLSQSDMLFALDFAQDIELKRKTCCMKSTTQRSAEWQGTTLEGYIGGSQEHVDKKSATGIGDEAATQKRKKWPELSKQDIEGSEVQKIGRP